MIGSQALLVDFSGQRQRHCRQPHNGIGKPPIGNTTPQGVKQRLVADVRASAGFDDQDRPLSPFFMGTPDDRRQGDLGQGADDGLNLCGIDPFALARPVIAR